MKKVAKLVIIDDNNHLLMYRNAHPIFGNDPDLPGGTLEGGEEPIEAMIREVYEEVGVKIVEAKVQKIYEGAEYSAHGTHYSLFIAKLGNRPAINMSWEHSGYEWLDSAKFIEKAENANDTYMHMVHDQLK